MECEVNGAGTESWNDAVRNLKLARARVANAEIVESLEQSFGAYSRKLGWGLEGHEPECWPLLDKAVNELARRRKERAVFDDGFVSVESLRAMYKECCSVNSRLRDDRLHEAQANSQLNKEVGALRVRNRKLERLIELVRRTAEGEQLTEIPDLTLGDLRTFDEFGFDYYTSPSDTGESLREGDGD